MARGKWFGWARQTDTWDRRWPELEMFEALEWAQRLADGEVDSVTALARELGLPRATVDGRLDRLRSYLLDGVTDAAVRSRARRPPSTARKCAEPGCEQVIPKRPRGARGRRPSYCRLHGSPAARACRSRASSRAASL
jgi:biotin operon repressor